MAEMPTYRDNIRKHQIRFAGTVVRKDETRLLIRIVFGRLVAHKEARRHLKDWEDRLQENPPQRGAASRKG